MQSMSYRNFTTGVIQLPYALAIHILLIKYGPLRSTDYPKASPVSSDSNYLLRPLRSIPLETFTNGKTTGHITWQVDCTSRTSRYASCRRNFYWTTSISLMSWLFFPGHETRTCCGNARVGIRFSRHWRIVFSRNVLLEQAFQSPSHDGRDGLPAWEQNSSHPLGEDTRTQGLYR